MNFDAMRTELEYQIFEQSIVINNSELGFEILENRVIDQSRRHIIRRRATINHPSWINNDVKQAIGRRQRANEAKRMIIIIIKKGRQCKAERELCTPYQSKDPSPTIPTYRMKEEKGEKSRRQQ